MPDLRAIVAARVPDRAGAERRLLSKYNSVIEKTSRKPPPASVEFDFANERSTSANEVGLERRR
jgi:hypothetical protein